MSDGGGREDPRAGPGGGVGGEGTGDGGGSVGAGDEGADGSDGAGGGGTDGDGGGGRLRRLLARYVSASRVERAAVSVLALVVAVVLGGAFVFGSGFLADCTEAAFLGSCYNPLRVYAVMFSGALLDPFGLAATLQATSLLVLTGLSVAVSFRAGLFNIGTQGQMVVGALVTGVLGAWLVGRVPAGTVGGTVVVLATVVAATVAGGLWGALPGVLKAYADANEVITTIMLNIIAGGLAVTLVRDVLGRSNIQTESLPAWARLTPVVAPPTSSFSEIALAVAVLAAVGVYYLLNYSAFGYDLRVSGLQPEAATYSGVDARRVVVSTMTLSGAFGGLAGAGFVLVANGYWTDGLPPYGFDGITVSVLAANNPVGVVLAAVLFGALRSGKAALQLQGDVPPEIVEVLRGIVILLVAMPEAMRTLVVRSGLNLPEEPGPGPGPGPGHDSGPDGGGDADGSAGTGPGAAPDADADADAGAGAGTGAEAETGAGTADGAAGTGAAGPGTGGPGAEAGGDRG